MWAAGIVLAALAGMLRPDGLPGAARATAGPFATLAAIILASALAGRIGVFRILARALIPRRGPAAAAAAAVLAFTAMLSALVNLDVAVVVAMPVALRAAQRQGLAAGGSPSASPSPATPPRSSCPPRTSPACSCSAAGRSRPPTSAARGYRGS